MQRKLKLFLFAVWFAAVTLPLAYAMLKHEVAFVPPDTTRVSRSLATLGVDLDKRWSLVHFLSTDCGCSKSIVDHLLERKAAAGASELVVLLGEDKENFSGALRQAKFDVRSLPTAALSERTGIDGVPWLLVLDPQGQARYSGGYSDRRISQDTKIDEVAWLRSLQAGSLVATRPAFGCAISQKLQKYLRPL